MTEHYARTIAVGATYHVQFEHGHAYLRTVGENADIVDLFVEEAHRGKGLGAEYVGELVRIAREKGVKCLVAHVNTGNVASLKAFKRAGFESSDESVEYHMELK